MEKRFLAVLMCMLVGMGCKSAPQSDRQAEIAVKSKCREDGAKFAAEWKSAHPSGAGAREFGDVTTAGGWNALDEYAYSPQLNSCLWYGEYLGARGMVGVLHVKLILDVYSNKKLIEYVESNGKQISEVTASDLSKKKAELFH